MCVCVCDGHRCDHRDAFLCARGKGADGELGNGGTADVLRPPSTDQFIGILQLTAGQYFTCAVTNVRLSLLSCWLPHI